ncbi:hypothetical protein APHAL10511_005021 [Amanita phalloides]|nr:hypothetical protein APHAL10511_005021 [Amanita phalloides]
MFKRVEKRLKKREEEIQLGIDEETRDILGLNDTDSDESESEPSEGENEVSTSEDEREEGWGGIGGNRVDGEKESGSSDEEDEEEEEEEEGSRHVAFQIFTAQQALDEPIYAHPTRNDLSQNTSHLKHAHERRSRHIANLASLPGHADSPLSDLMQLMEGVGRRVGFQPPDGQTGDKGTSKRAEKKRKVVEIRKSMREKKKAREREKKEEQKAEEEKHTRGGQKPAKAPAAAPSSKKEDKSKDRLSAKPAQAKQPEPSTKKAAEKAMIGKQRNDKKRRKGTEKEKDSVVTTDNHGSVKKRKTDDEDILKEEVAQQIKDIAKSATVRARSAQSKAKQNGKPKPKKGNKST